MAKQNLEAESTVEQFELLLKSPTGVAVSKLSEELSRLLQKTNSPDTTSLRRLAKGRWKKIIDEVAVFDQYLKYRQTSQGFVHFPMDSNTPDCWYWVSAGDSKQGIEITIALGQTRHLVNSRLNEVGMTSGYIHASETDFKAQEREVASDPSAYSTEPALDKVTDAIISRLAAKSDARFSDLDLIIEAPLYYLAWELWDSMWPRLKSVARELPLREVHVVGDGRTPGIGYRIK